MKIRQITVVYEVKGEQEEMEVSRLIASIGGNADRQPTQRASQAGPESYTPASDRTRAALEAVNACERVKLHRPSILEKWSTAFPDVDLAAEIRKAESWACSKLVTRSPKGWARTLNTWLGKAQDQIRRAPGYAPPAAPVVAGNLNELRKQTEGWSD